MDTLELLRPSLAGRYELLREIGRGGMARVYLARDVRHDRVVAIKVLRPDVASTIGAGRFRNEIDIIAALQHPHILGLIDSGLVDGTCYYSMPFVDGESLRQRLDRETQLPLDDVVRIVGEIAGALDYAHGRGVIHRDIKPENILLSAGHALVMDFGIARAISSGGGARLTEVGMALGTPTYMSPEQSSAMSSIDGRSDTYALACIAYEMLAGAPPFEGPTAQAILAKHAIDPVPGLRSTRATVPPGIEWAIVKAMAKVPADRFPSAGAFAAMLANPERARASAARRRRPTRALLTVGALAVAATAMTYRAVSGDGRINSVAVLPVHNLTGDTAQIYLSDQMTDQVFTDLAQVQALKVISRASVAAAGGGDTAQPAERTARKLGVDAVLVSELKGRGDSLNLAVQLISARNGQAVWAGRYAGTARDMPRIEGQVAEAVVQRIGVVFRTEERARLVSNRRVDPGAFSMYTKGRYFWNKRDIFNLQRARTLFTQALDADPTYAAAYAGLADTYNQLGYLGGLPPGDAFPKAKTAAARALDLDSTNAEAHVALAYARMYYDWDFAAAEREFRTGITLNPNWATAHDQYSLFLLAMGRFDEAESEVQRAVILDPLSAPIAGEAGWVSHYRGRQDEALGRMLAAVAMDTANSVNHFQLGRVYQALGRFQDALHEYEVAEGTGFVTGIGAMGYVEAALGNPKAARTMRAKLDSVTRSGHYTSPYVVALVHTGLGDRDSAFVWLNRAVNEHTHWVLWLNRDPRWNPLRADGRFLELTRRIPLPP